jgi:hypothetical protein
MSCPGLEYQHQNSGVTLSPGFGRGLFLRSKPMADRYFKGEVKTLEGGVIKLFGTFTIGAAGAVSTSVTKGFSVSKVAAEAGRYKVLLEDAYSGLLNAQATVVGAADAPYGNTDGLLAIIRNVSVTTKPASFDLQLASVAGADAEPTLGTVILLEVTLKNTSSY